MQLDFWQLSSGSVGQVVALIAGRARGDGAKLLVIDSDAERRGATSRALWEAKPETFLANGDAAEPHAKRQPILLSETCEAANGARLAIIADGQWRDEGEGFDRTIMLFDEAGTPAARAMWRQFDGREDVERRYFAQEDRKWVKKA
jgi:DNA polymerase-3 subunit chi